MCYLAERGHYALRGVGINRGEPNIADCWGFAPGMGGVADSKKHAPPPHVLPAEGGRSALKA